MTANMLLSNNNNNNNKDKNNSEVLDKETFDKLKWEIFRLKMDNKQLEKKLKLAKVHNILLT
jgi:uncharacterized protein (DUF488 family)